MVVFYDTNGKIQHAQQGNTPSMQYTGLTALVLDDVQYAGVYNAPTEYTIQNSVPVSTPTPAATQLSNAQNAQIAVIQTAYENAQVGGFTSSATGTAHAYYNDLSSQVKFNAMMNRLNLDTMNNITTIPWLTSAGMVNHARTQFIQVFDDGVAYEQNVHAHLERLIGQVNAATTVSQAQSYTWTTPPNVPTGLTGTAGTGQVSLSWTANTEGDLAGYNVYQNGVKVNSSLLTVTTDTVTGLTSSTTYNFTITAVDVLGNESAQCTAVSVKAN